jgi:hypothetical protein
LHSHRLGGLTGARRWPMKRPPLALFVCFVFALPATALGAGAAQETGKLARVGFPRPSLLPILHSAAKGFARVSGILATRKA